MKYFQPFGKPSCLDLIKEKRQDNLNELFFYLYFLISVSPFKMWGLFVVFIHCQCFVFKSVHNFISSYPLNAVFRKLSL